jgi:hypothetical protein
MSISAVRRARAVGVEAEGAMYGGQNSGGWLCGPMGSVRYGGVGSQITVSQRDRSAPEGQGPMLNVGFGAERDAVRLTNVTNCKQDCAVSPLLAQGSLLLGGRARLGWGYEHVSVQAGAGLYQTYDGPLGVKPGLSIYPDGEIAFGKLNRIYGLLGAGSSEVTTFLRPGAYAGLGVGSAAGLGLELHGGYFVQGPVLGTAGAHLDLVGRAPIPFTKRLHVRLGGSLGRPDVAPAPLDWEGSVGLACGY